MPYGGRYGINRPDIGIVGSGINLGGVMREVSQWRRANGLPNGLGLQDQVVQAICEKYPAECEDDNPHEPMNPRQIGYQEVILGTRVMASFAASGFETVPKEEAERRAELCAKCRMNVPFAKPCGGICGALLDIAKRVIGGLSTTRDEQLNACFICGCFLKVAVHFPLKLQWEPLSEEQKIRFTAQSEHCWKHL